MIKSIRIYDRLGNNSHTGAYSKSTHLDILHAAQSTNLNFCANFIVEDRRIEGDDPKSVFWFRSELESLQGLSIIQNYGRSTDSSEGMATSSSCSCFSSWHPDVIEFEQMFLPMYALSVVGGSARFTEKQRALFFRHYFPWAIRAGMASTNLRCVYYEKHFTRTWRMCGRNGVKFLTLILKGIAEFIFYFFSLVLRIYFAFLSMKHP
ncbi:unnamed protein product [Musa acuminata var. zebrina]